MSPFTLHPQLETDCHMLGRWLGCHLLLHRNGSLPWYILVPETTAGELHQLSTGERTTVDQAMDSLARFVLSHHGCERTNVAAIGNRVSQLHIHVVGRWAGDPCWPGVVWGQLPEAPERSAEALGALHQALSERSEYHPAPAR